MDTDTSIRTIALATGLLLTSTALPAPLESGAMLSVDDCELLRDPVQITLSKNVKATYVCNMLTGSIGLGTCHVYGRRQATLSDGSETSNGIVYTLTSDRDGGRMIDLAGCPVGETPIPDEMIDTGVE